MWNPLNIIRVELGKTLSGEDILNDRLKVEHRFQGENITLAAPTTTLLKTGSGTLGRVIVNRAAANGVITIYDNVAASGRVLATITMPAVLLASQLSLLYDLEFFAGLTVVTSGAAQDVTILYR